uniref:protein-serine/threonine phosphatase n=1 Tax=Zea mays TaxID=4577 RepID=A0A804MDM5_MAIZE
MTSGPHESMGDGTGQGVFESGKRVPPVSDRVRNRDISPGFSPFGTLRRSRRLDAVQSGCSALSIVKQGDLMVVANVNDSRVVLGTAVDDDAITPSSSSST